MRFSIKDRYNYLRSSLGENEILDEKTLHKLVTASDGKVVEMKWCPECKTWHPLSDFRKFKNSKIDGLTGVCKYCMNKRKKNKVRIHKTSRAVSIPFNTPIPVVEKEPECPNGMDSIINSIREEFRKKQKEIDELKKQVAQLSATNKDLTKLTTADAEYVVNHYDIAPRLLFNAIKRQTSQYVFYAYDTVSGAHIPIKEEKSA